MAKDVENKIRSYFTKSDEGLENRHSNLAHRSE